MSTYLLFVGPPGSGKGTQAELLAKVLLIPRISAGDLLREAASGDGAFAASIRVRLEAGSIIEDSFVMQMIDRRLDESDCKRGAILDGCVRTFPQVAALDRIMMRRGGITLIISLRISDDLAASRMESRWTHRATGAPLSPKQPRTANFDNRGYYRRPEDEPQVIKERQRLYWKCTEQAVKNYRTRKSFVELDGARPIEAIHQDIVNALRVRLRGKSYKR